MNEINTAFWAKKQDRNGRFEWLPLSQHLEDTRQVARLLWTHWLSEGQRQSLIEALNPSSENVALSLVEFLAGIHDLGKATPAFQLQKGFTNTPDLDAALVEKLEGAGFTDLKFTRLANPEKSPHAIAGQYLVSEYGVDEDIASIVGAHHGKPVDDDKKIQNQSAYERNYCQIEKNNDPIHQKWKNEQEKVFHWALKTSGFENVKDLPSINQPGQVLLSGLLIMADWIASNEKYFPLIPLESSSVDNPEDRIMNGFTQWIKEASFPWQADFHTPESIYQKRFGFQPRNVQSVFAEIIENTDDPGIFILEAPMGLGKTEAALVAAEQLAYKTGRSGLFFGLPTQATSNGIYPRINSWLESVAKDNGDKLGIRLLHGKAALNPDYDHLIKKSSAQNINVDEDEFGSVTVNAWFSGRKTASLDDFIVGTVDQFLMVALKQKHLALRHLGFSKKVVVIDEVHAYDAYMSQYLDQAVRWMGAYGVPVVILSATLPADRRKNLIENYMRGKGLSKRDWTLPEKGIEGDAYPLITYSDDKSIKQADQFETIENKSVQVFRHQNEDLISLITDLIQEGGIVGLIVNTVKKAQSLAQTCTDVFGSDKVMLLHSAFIATDRIEKENQLLRMIGKEADRPHQKIIIGTQVIEQSLDIDFDVIISDLAPMDLLIQRIGRLHRHNISRPKDHQEAKLYVLGTSDSLEFESGSQAVYGGYLLARTQAFLPDILSIPEDISPLVQKVYKHESIDVNKQAQPLLEEMETEHRALLDNKEKKAKTYRIEEPVLKPSRRKSNTLIGWLKNKSPNESEEMAYAQVRDTQETIEIIALKKIDNGYGFFDSNKDISDHIQDAAISKKIAQNTLKLPGVLSTPYRIEKTIQDLEKYNLNSLKDWQKQAWLKGSLGIIFNADDCFELNGYILKYDRKLGLTYEEVKNEPI